MDANNKQTYNSRFKLEKPPEDYGKLIYEFDDSHTMYDMSKHRRRRIPKSPGGIYLLTVLALLVVWFLYSLISAVVKFGFVYALAMHISGFMLLAVAGAIIILSAFGLWGKFARFAFKHNLAHGKDASERRHLKQLKEGLEEADKRKPVRNELSIYEDYIVIVNCGKRAVYDRLKVKGVRLTKYGYGKKVAFMSELGETAYASAVLPREAVTEINRIFRDLIVKPRKYKYKEPVNNYKRGRNSSRKRTWTCDKSAGQLVGLTLFMFIPIAAGAAVIAMHYYFNERIPIFLGAFFIAGGILALCTVYSFIPLIKTFFIPFAFGALFCVFPLGLLSAIFADKSLSFDFIGIFGTFTPLSAGMVFLTLVGIVLVVYSFVSLYKYIRYGDY